MEVEMSEASNGGNEGGVVKNYHFSGVERAESAESAILSAVRGIRYGSVEVTIHDSRVVLIECKRKIRVQSGVVTN
ncbi:MAG: YezD family protein [Acidobacteriota bacterium]|jgi:hypothetical protein|nr:YezD family protein [Acidobacteriota bacterium]